MEKYNDHPEVLVADVDCTASGKTLCETHGVQGFPTIKYGNPEDLEDYEGGRSFDDLAKFAQASIGKQNLVEGGAMQKALKKGQKTLKKYVYPLFDHVVLVYTRVPDAAIFITIVCVLIGFGIGVLVGSSGKSSAKAPPKKKEEKKDK